MYIYIQYTILFFPLINLGSHQFVGTDTIGGVRVPASFCGILGYRSSHGAVSTIGVLPSSQSLDTVGMMIVL